jgi:UDP-glucose 4-epimerase
VKVLVTGGAGYIGSHVVRQLGEAGHGVLVLDDLSTGSAQAVLHGELVRGDLGDRDLLHRVLAEHRPGAVLHFAASIVVPDSVARPLEYYHNNLVNTLGLLEACARHGVDRFVFSSSAAVYGEPEVEAVTEETPLAPINPYGASKAMVEQVLRDAAGAGPLRYAALRYFNVAGADPGGRIGQSTPRATHLIKLACQAALGLRDGLDLYGTDYPTPDGTCIRDYIHVEDLASAHLSALRHLEGGGASTVLNVGYGRGHSVLEVVDAVRRVSGADFPVRPRPRRAGDPARLVSSNRRILETLDWRPAHDDLDGIVRDALRWERRLAGLP